MNAPRDPDAVLAAWLEEGPSRLPDATRHAIAVGVRSTRQARGWIGRPAWIDGLFRFQALAGAAAVAIAALVVVVVLPAVMPARYPSAGGSGAACPMPSALPSASASGSPIVLSTFVSPTYGYTICYPADWSVTPGRMPLPDAAAGGAVGDDVPDVFRPPPGPSQSYLEASSDLLPDGVSESAWLDAWLVWGDPATSEACIPPFGEWSHLTVDGVDVAWYNGLVVSDAKSAVCHWADAIAFSGGRAYVFGLKSAYATSIGIFEQMLSTITFRPQDADDTAATTSPSPVSASPSP